MTSDVGHHGDDWGPRFRPDPMGLNKRRHEEIAPPPPVPTEKLQRIAALRGAERVAEGLRYLSNRAMEHNSWRLAEIWADCTILRNQDLREWALGRRDELLRQLKTAARHVKTRVGKARWTSETRTAYYAWRTVELAAIGNEVFTIVNFTTTCKVEWLKHPVVGGAMAATIVALLWLSARSYLENGEGKLANVARSKTTAFSLMVGLVVMTAFTSSVGEAFDSVNELAKGELPTLPLPTALLSPVICLASAVLSVNCGLRADAVLDKVYRLRWDRKPETELLEKELRRAKKQLDLIERRLVEARSVKKAIDKARKSYVRDGLLALREYCAKVDRSEADSAAHDKAIETLRAAADQVVKATALHKIAENHLTAVRAKQARRPSATDSTS